MPAYEGIKIVNSQQHVQSMSLLSILKFPIGAMDCSTFTRARSPDDDANVLLEYVLRYITKQVKRA